MKLSLQMLVLLFVVKNYSKCPYRPPEFILQITRGSLYIWEITNWIFMSTGSPKFIFSKSGKIVLMSSILAAIFWWMAKTVDVYKSSVVGAIFEILWLPMLALLFILPVISFIFWRKDKFNVRSISLYSLLIGIATAVLTILAK